MKNIAKLFALMALLMIGANNSILQAAILVDSIYYDVDNTGTSAYNIINTIERPDIREEGESEIKDGDKFEKDGIFYTVISVSYKTLEVTFKGETANEFVGEYSGSVVVPRTVNYENRYFKVDGIGKSAFDQCAAVTSVVLPNSLTYIEAGAFNGTSISSIILPASVRNVGSEAFSGCLSLDSLYMERKTPPEAYENTFTTYKTTVLIVPVGAKSAYQSANVWKNFFIIREEIENGDKFEKDGIYYEIVSAVDKTVEVTFKGETAKEFVGEYSGSVVIPQTVNYGNTDFKVVGIGKSAFYQCSAVSSVVLPSSVTYIEAGAFNGTSISSIILPASVSSVAGYAFANCNYLTSIILERSTPPEAHDTSFNTYETTVLTVPVGAKSAYQTADVWKKFITIREEGETEENESLKDGGKFRKDGIFCMIISVADKTVEVTFAGETYSEVEEYSGDVVIPQTVNYGNIDFKVVGIGNDAFRWCSGLTSISIPNSVTSIGQSAFSSCSGLTSVTIPNSVTSIGDEAFAYCVGLKSVTIPNSVTSIGNDAFRWCSGLTSISIPNSVTSIGQSAFSFCSGLTSVTIPNSVTSIGDEAFAYCEGLKSVTIPNSVTSIGYAAFSNCSGLTSISIPNSVTSIGRSAFFNCSGLTSVTIPNSVTSIRDYAFYECNSLASIILEGGTPPTAYDFSFSTYETTVITVPVGAKYAYQSADVWKNFVTIREEGEKDGDKFEKDGIYYKIISGADKTVAVTFKGVTSEEFVGEYYGSVIIPLTVNYENTDFKVVGIGKLAFSHCSDLTSISIPNSVTSIGDNVFEACDGLTSISIPNSVTSIGDWAFSYCSGLTSVTIPNSITSIGDWAFIDCYGLTSISIPNSITSIGDWAFYDCYGLTSISIPNSVTSIGDGAFSYCYGLTSISIPNSVTSIGEFAFSDCSGLTSISIPNSVTSIGNSAFSYCSGLASISIPNSVTSIGNSAFSYCSGLTSVTIPTSVTSIGDWAFYNCSRLKSVTIPNSVTSIGDNAFADCISLASIILDRSTPPEAHDTSFNTYETTVLIVPAGAKSAYQSADVWKNFVTILEEGDKFEKDGIYYKIVSAKDKTVEVTFKGETYDEVDNEYQGDVVIPQTVRDVDFTVVGVGEKALYGCDNIRKLYVPLTVNYFDKGSVNSETLRELYWNSTSRFSKSIFVNPDAATNMILYITTNASCDYDVNVVRNGVSENIVLTDGMPLQITTGFKAKSISYTRHFDKVTVPRKPGGWESIVLPFDVQSFVSDEAGEIAPFNSGKSGAKPFMLAQMTGNGFAVATEMKANVPYILVMPNSEMYYEKDNISGEVKFCAESASGVTVYPTADAEKVVGKEFDLVPTYEEVERDLAVYALNEGMYNDFIPGSAFVSGLRIVKPFEAYASVESKPANAKTYFVIGGNDSATDIMRLYDDMFDGLEIDSRDGVLYIQSPKAQNIGLYGSDGRLVRILRLTEGSNTVTGLSKGVYVIGKKKVVFNN